MLKLLIFLGGLSSLEGFHFPFQKEQKWVLKNKTPLWYEHTELCTACCLQDYLQLRNRAKFWDRVCRVLLSIYLFGLESANSVITLTCWMRIIHCLRHICSFLSKIFCIYIQTDMRDGWNCHAFLDLETGWILNWSFESIPFQNGYAKFTRN